MRGGGASGNGSLKGFFNCFASVKNANFAGGFSNNHRQEFLFAKRIGYGNNPAGKCLHAFTLAEVLITLGIIGIVAAMTLPSVIGNAQKEAAAAKVHKFYNTINNAVQFAIVEYGDVENWMGERKGSTYEENLEFLNKYFLPHLKYNRYDNCIGNKVCVYLTSGGMFTFGYDKNGGDIVYFINGKYERSLRNYFAFQFNKIDGTDEDGNAIHRSLNRRTAIEPYAFNWDGTYEKLITHSSYGCRKGGPNTAYCAKLLQYNNWKFPKDYPW